MTEAKEKNVQEVIDITQTNQPYATFETEKNNKNDLEERLLAPNTPHDIGHSKYWDEDQDSLPSSQIVKPSDNAMTRRQSSVAAFVEQKEASIFSSCMNLSNTILGAGLLGLPYAMSKSGYILAFILFIIMGCLSSIGLNLAMSAAKVISPKASYYTLSELSVPRAKKLVDLAVAIKYVLHRFLNILHITNIYKIL